MKFSPTLRRVDLRGKKLSKSAYQDLLPRGNFDISAALKIVEPLIAEVRAGSDLVLKGHSLRFDGVAPQSIRVPAKIISESVKNLDSQLRIALEESIRRVRIVHENQRRSATTTHVVAGGEVTQRWVPVDRVGLYVPGGRAVYPSSVIMNVLPAQIAGVMSIALASPPQKENNGWPHPTILATCALLGIDEVYAMGGASAIAAFAYGIRSESGGSICEKVDLVTGPGNIYVAAAKRSLRGVIGIDSEAGPTEIAIIADESAIASDVATDLISQAEHDPMAAALLITTSLELAESVQREITDRVSRTKHGERITAALTGQQSAIILVSDLEQGIDVANAYAAEHLELQIENAQEWSKKIRNAGAIFIGRFSPVSLGDYSAGSNHVLPTGGCACHSSGLTVATFLRSIHSISYSERAFNEIAESVITLANSEDLPAHGEAMQARFEKK